MRTPPRSSRPELPGRDRTIILAVATGAAALCALAQVAVYVAAARTRGDGAGAELVLNLLLDASLPLVTRFPRAVGGVAVAVTSVSAVGVTLAPGLVTPLHEPTVAPMAAGIVVSFLTYLLPWRQALAFAAVLAVSAIPIWAPTWVRLASALSATALPALVALYVRTRVELVRALRRRAELADSERRLLAERAETAERQRLASEMHDIVTHHVTEIALHADALRVTARDDDTRSAAEQIRRSATRTLTELRDLIGVLTTGAPAVPRPRGGENAGDGDAAEDTGGDLAALAAADRATLHVEGDPGSVPAVVARTVYRVVQEALTNARKHAPGAPVTIRVAYPGDRVDVEVRNAPPRRRGDPGLTGTGSGIGLAGLDRRVAMLGGAFHAEGDDQGGFTVTATIPAVSGRTT